MTDAEMEKAMEICKNTEIPCNDCPLAECNDCERISLQYFYDRFKQLKVENTDLSKRICILEHALDVCEDLYIMAIEGKAYEGPSLKAITSGLSLHDFLMRWAEESIQQIEKDFAEEKKDEK